MKALGLLLASQALCLSGETSNPLPIATSCVPVVRSIAPLALFIPLFAFIAFLLFIAWCHLWSATFDKVIYLDASDQRKHEGENKKRPCKIHHLGLKLQILFCELIGFKRDALLLRCVIAGHFGELREQEGKPVQHVVCGSAMRIRCPKNLNVIERLMYVLFGGLRLRWRRSRHIFSANVPRQVSLAGGVRGSQRMGAKALGLLFCQQALCLSGGMSKWCSSKLPTGQRLTGRVCSAILFI